MKKFLSVILSVALIFSFAACSKGTENVGTADNSQSQTTESGSENKDNILIAYFSRAGENYGVGTVEMGSTEIVVQMIADECENADLFKIETEYEYPSSYDEATKIAKEEQESGARPKLKSSIENFDDYGTVFIGYPISYADMPMVVYTFLESYNFDGKTVIPFCTHAGSGLASTENTIRNTLKKSNVLSGFAVKGVDAQNDTEAVRQTVKEQMKKYL